MGDDLMAVEIEIDPMVGAAPLGAAKQLPIEVAGGGKIVDWGGEGEGRKAHFHAMSFPPPQRQGGAIHPFVHCFVAALLAMKLPMLIMLYAFLAGAASAFAFEPAGLWPLLLLALAFLCELLDRTKSLPRALLIGWAFGLGQFVVGLNW